MKKLILSLSLSFLLGNLFAQTYLPVTPTTYGANNNRVKVSTAILLPTKCGVPGSVITYSSDSTQAILQYDSCGHKWYGYDPSTNSWNGITSDNLMPFATPYQFGGIGDGVTNDYSAVQSCFNTKHCYIPTARWLTNSTILVPDSATITGNSASSIIFTNSNIDLLSATNKTSIAITNIVLQKNGSRSSAKGIMFNGSTFQSTLVSNVKLYGFDKGFYYTGNYLNHYALRVSDCVGIDNNTSFYNDDYGEYVIYNNCDAEYNTTGLYSIAGNVSYTGGSLTNNSIGAKFAYGANDGHSILNGTLVNHNIDDIIVDSVQVSLLITGVHCFFGDVQIKNSNNVSLVNCQFNRNDTFSITKSRRTFITNPVFYQRPANLIIDTSKVVWFNPNFFDRTTSLVPSTINGDVDIRGGIRLKGRDSTNLLAGIVFSNNNVNEEDIWWGVVIRQKNISSESGALEIRTHPANATPDTNTLRVIYFDENQNTTVSNNLTSATINSGNITSTGTVAAVTLSGTITTVSQPNITSLGTLSTLTVTNTLTTGKVSTGVLTATTGALTLVTASQPNITSVGTLTQFTVSGLSTLSSVNISNLTVTGSITSANNSSTGYAPTSSFQSNVTSYSFSDFSFTRDGPNVIVSGYVTIVPTVETTITYLRFTVPIPFTYTSTTTFNGSINLTDGGVVFTPGQISANNAGSSVGAGLVSFVPPLGTGGVSYGGRFTALYKIQ